MKRIDHSGLGLVVVVFITVTVTSCGFLPFLATQFSGGGSADSSVTFDIEGATAIAGSDSASRFLGSMSVQARAALSRAGEDAALVKIMEDGSLQSAIDFGGQGMWQPNIAFLSVGDDGSVYICFESIFQSWNTNGSSSIQFVRVYPDGETPYDVLWPLNPSDFSWQDDGQVQTWNWYGMDTDPLAKGPDGKLYFIISKNSGTSSEQVVYRYDPETGATPVAVTPTGASIQISTFQVDYNNRIFVHSNGNYGGTSQYLKYYYPNVTAPKNIYYSSDNTTWVRGYSPDPLGRYLILNGYGINKRADGSDNGMSGIIKVTFNATDPMSISFRTMYPSGSNYVRLSKWVDETWESGTEILIYDNTDTVAPWSWNDDVLTNGSPDATKILGKISNLYMDTPIRNAVQLPTNEELNAPYGGTFSRLGDMTWSYTIGNIPFLDLYFEGTTLTEYLDARGYSGLTFDNLGSLQWLTDGSLYGLYDNQWWGMGGSSSSGKIIKLLDANGERDLDIIELEKGDQKPSLIKVSGDIFFYRYSNVDTQGVETGTHRIASVNPVTGVQNVAVLPISVPDIEVLAYDVTGDNQTLYFVGFDSSTNSVLSGKVNIAASTWERLDTAARLSKIRTID